MNDQFTAQFRQPNDAVQRHVLGDEGKAVRHQDTALLCLGPLTPSSTTLPMCLGSRQPLIFNRSLAMKTERFVGRHEARQALVLAVAGVTAITSSHQLGTIRNASPLKSSYGALRFSATRRTSSRAAASVAPEPRGFPSRFIRTCAAIRPDTSSQTMVTIRGRVMRGSW